MSRITITVDTKTVSLTEKFDTEKYGSTLEVLKAAIAWLKLGSPLEGTAQYNYDTPAKPATDHEEVAPDPDIQKQRERTK